VWIFGIGSRQVCKSLQCKLPIGKGVKGQRLSLPKKAEPDWKARKPLTFYVGGWRAWSGAGIKIK